ncbi:MAG: hypothetical protein HPY61_13800 [Methanotrichaceae archaeon]|nr:hypothetical protein [Methanotrichaceae archaeon]
MKLSDPLKKPGTRLAKEHHGGKAGRVWKFDRTEIEGVVHFLPRQCPQCREIFVFNKRDEPLCPCCGTIQGEEPRKESEKIEKYRRLKAAKRARIIHGCRC